MFLASKCSKALLKLRKIYPSWAPQDKLFDKAKILERVYSLTRAYKKAHINPLRALDPRLTLDKTSDRA